MADVGMKSKRRFRKRKDSSDDSDDDDPDIIIEAKTDTVTDIKEYQRQRCKQFGVSADALAHGKELNQTQTLSKNDPLKMKTGGIVDMKALKTQKLTDEDGEAIGTAFAAETNRRDEDTEMLKYVEDELAKRKGQLKEESTIHRKRLKSDDLYIVPENLATKSRLKHKEDSISSQMLSGIPEVDLGIESKIVNIEKTEEAKHELMMERLRKKEDQGSEFIPTNMAVNFMQHNRFNVEDHLPSIKKVEPVPEVQPLRVGDAERLQSQGVHSRCTDKATDDVHYARFRRKMKY